MAVPTSIRLPWNPISETPERAAMAAAHDSEFKEKGNTPFDPLCVQKALGYSPFDPTAHPDTSNETCEQIHTIQEGIHTPHIIALERSGMISRDESLIIQAWLVENPDIHSIWDIDGISHDTRAQLQEYMSYIHSKEGQERAQDLFEREFGGEFIEFYNEKGELCERDQESFDMISSHYFPLGDDPNDSAAQKYALDAAFESALNTEIDGKNFERTVTYQQLETIIRDGSQSIVARFIAFSQMRDEIDTHQGKGGKKQADAFRQGVTRARAETRDAAILHATHTPKQQDNPPPPDDHQVAQNGDIFGGGSNDVSPDNGYQTA